MSTCQHHSLKRVIFEMDSILFLDGPTPLNFQTYRLLLLFVFPHLDPKGL
ncbi:hypothetical protein HanXRQr2_Chr13g0568611 [Helianthus annuus]|uniref:Uncharacterized protein n=1 Tax=Helianthus annuus TaxID=4232 RepID=A0A9K3EET1_HELAN|nr:hypothetical protein HanXRQr2_Chr13g0568611 [Helianthus annuus]